MTRACLTTECGEAVPPVFELDPETTASLGRSRDNTIVLHDEHASRQHAQICFRDGQWVLRDFGALNGTRIDGKPIQQHAVLQHGQEIGIAEMRLRFTLLEAPRPTLVTGPAVELPAPAGPLPALADDDSTSLQADELAVLYDFVTRSAEETDQQALVRYLLEVVALKMRAGVVGFLSFDPDNPLPKMVLPEVARVDIALGRRLNQRARLEGRTVRLPQGENDADRSESLLPFQDALCVPLKDDGAPLGALHVYRSGTLFTQREIHFCEVAAGHAAPRLARLRELRSLTAENSRLRVYSTDSSTLVGDGPAMRRLRDLIIRAASCNAPVLIHGETGAGKELVAFGVHAQSARARGPFVVSNCGAIMPSLLESELFGHVKGAFTGALIDRKGLFEQADDGTLFLDEIGDMSLECQVKLLRVIEGKPFHPVGGAQIIQTDVRVVAATHKDLEQEVRAGHFRQDLFYRLAVVHVRVPPLREHPEDIPALADHFLERLAAANRQRRKTLSATALQRLQEFAWPGNVRQLRTALESAMVMGDGDTIEEANLWLSGASNPDQPLTLNLEELTEWAVRRALERTDGNLAQAAELLGKTRETVRTMKKKYGL